MLAEKVNAAADWFDNNGYETIEMEMIPTLRDGITDIAKWIGKLVEIHEKMKLSSGFPPMPEKQPRTIAEAVEVTHEKLEKARKKNKESF